MISNLKFIRRLSELAIDMGETLMCIFAKDPFPDCGVASFSASFRNFEALDRRMNEDIDDWNDGEDGNCGYPSEKTGVGCLYFDVMFGEGLLYELSGEDPTYESFDMRLNGEGGEEFYKRICEAYNEKYDDDEMMTKTSGMDKACGIYRASFNHYPPSAKYTFSDDLFNS